MITMTRPRGQLRLSFPTSQWLQARIVVGRLERTVLWLIGDWWRFGNKTYGSGWPSCGWTGS